LTTEPAADKAADRATTKLTVPFVPLPKEPGRHTLVLPPVPVAVARASGEVVSVCTTPHAMVVDDPIANELDPKVRPNPRGRHQREEWVAAKYAALALLVGAIIGVFLTWLLRRWARRPRPVIVVPPKLP